MDAGTAGTIGVFIFLAAGAISLFSFLGVAAWSDARRRERESYYKNDMLKKLAEAQGPGVQAALDLLREETRIRAMKKRQEMRIGGLLTAAVGLALLIFLRALIPGQAVYLCGLIPLLIGLAMLGGSYMVVAVAE